MAGALVLEGGDGVVIDGFGPDGIAASVLYFTRRAVSLQTGFVYHYAFAMLLGIAGLVSWFMLTGAIMTDWPILSTITFLPLLGAFFILLIRGDEATAANNAKAVALWTSVVTLFLTGFMVSQFDGSSAAFQFVERINWLGDGVDYAMGVDGISVLFVLLTAALMPICILASWHSITHRVREYMLAFLLLETLMIGVFCAMDLILFYLFFEGGLIPMFLIIGIWGGGRRLCQFQVFPVHVAGLGSDAVGGAWYVLANRHDIHSRPDGNGICAGLAKLVVARVFCVLRRQNANVAGAYLVA